LTYMKLCSRIIEFNGGRFHYRLVVVGDFNRPQHYASLCVTMAGTLGLSPLLDTGEPQHATFARPNTPASLLDNIFSPAAAEATLVDIDHAGSPSDHAFVVADLPASGLDTSCAGEPDPAHTIRFNRLRRPRSEEDCQSIKNLQERLQALTASLESIKIDMAQLNDELLASARATLGTHPPRPPLRKPWMAMCWFLNVSS
jgi:hypothetical protein